MKLDFKRNKNALRITQVYIHGILKRTNERKGC